MKPQSFNVEFDYPLSGTITLKITAAVELHHSQPHYRVSNFHFKNHMQTNALLPDIDIMAIKQKNEISWVHTDSMKETILSCRIGKAIEERGDFEFANL